jgi:hypothetical protein
MDLTKFLNVNDIGFDGAVLLPDFEQYIPVTKFLIENIHPGPMPNEFRLLWSDRTSGNSTRQDGVTCMHAYVKAFSDGWRVFIQEESGWQNFVTSEDEASDWLQFITTQRYAIDPAIRE